jgi:putative ABC transport system ATP-binding protein
MNPAAGKSKAGQPLIRLRKVAKSYRMGEVTVHALRDFTLDIYPGQVTVILGPSGCGKTTLLNQIGGIDSPTSGQVLIEGRDISGMSQKELTRYRQEKIGFVFQFFNLIPNLTARENIEFVLEYVMEMKDDGGDRAGEILRKVGLGDRADHFPYQLSGGEQQRVSIARALSKDPPILLADEPTGELDYRTGLQILGLLHRFAREGKAVLIVTHNKEISRMADKVVFLRDGRVKEIKDNPDPVPVTKLEW